MGFSEKALSYTPALIGWPSVELSRAGQGPLLNGLDHSVKCGCGGAGDLPYIERLMRFTELSTGSRRLATCKFSGYTVFSLRI